MIKYIFLLLLISNIVNANSYRNNKTNIIVDRDKNLMWQDINIQNKAIVDSIDYCRNLNLGGYRDWKTPTISQLESLVELRTLIKSKYVRSEEKTYRLLSSKKNTRKLKCEFSKNNKNEMLVEMGGDNVVIAKWDGLTYTQKQYCTLAYALDYSAFNVLKTKPLYRKKDKANIVCVRKISKKNISNSCNNIQYTLPKKNKVMWMKRYYKECSFEATIHSYNPKTKMLSFSYDLYLPGLKKMIFNEKISHEKLCSFPSTIPGKMIFKATLGINENEEFYIRKIFYPSFWQVEEIKKAKEIFLKNYLVEGVLLLPSEVKYRNTSKKKIILRENTNIIYDPVTLEIIKPKKFNKKGMLLYHKPSLKKEVVILQNVDYKERKSNLITIRINSNFKVKKVEKDIFNKGFQEVKGKVNSEWEKWHYYFKLVLEKNKANYIIRLIGEKVVKTFDCNIKNGCKERKAILFDR